MRVNARGMAVCVKQVSRKMIEMGTRGSIVCTGSVAAEIGGPDHTDYNMSKHAVLGLVRSASMQLGMHGIRINCVSPAAVLTPLARNLFTSLKGVTLTAEHVAEAVLFLASDDSAFVTGHNLVVDGGMICIPFMVK
ncbi:(-)-isopiperitenol/(-)-carveol dehydrogenase mitochondrial [Phtheirospermum japonicum]|uniref:(-)-isopiperitenol/(-)-carveol dehydrogenase mitochondrial n=1 Tax=Phtheirospermum japonicum TaxID=374723 RepID=A0A830D9H4_9LAMI|nr:(-)-isopiperitenol/(-)-carveol dehydrogenase mitochondrial [Phtheirospermum japonicum]